MALCLSASLGNFVVKAVKIILTFLLAKLREYFGDGGSDMEEEAEEAEEEALSDGETSDLEEVLVDAV